MIKNGSLEEIVVLAEFVLYLEVPFEFHLS